MNPLYVRRIKYFGDAASGRRDDLVQFTSSQGADTARVHLHSLSHTSHLRCASQFLLLRSMQSD